MNHRKNEWKTTRFALLKTGPFGPEMLLVLDRGSKNHPRVWRIPGGKVEDNERVIDTHRREFEEEVGVPIPKVPLLFGGESIEMARSSGVHFIVGITPKAPDFDFKGTEEIEAVRWFSLDDLPLLGTEVFSRDCKTDNFQFIILQKVLSRHFKQLKRTGLAKDFAGFIQKNIRT